MTESAYQSHPLHTTLKQLLELQLDKEMADGRLALTEDQAWQLDRVFEIGRVVEDRLEQTPSTLTSFNALTNLNSSFQQAFSELSAFKKNKNAGHLSNANSHAETSITQIAALSAGGIGLSGQGLNKLLEDLRSRSHETLSVLQENKVALTAEVEKLRATIEAQASRLSELATSVETQKKEATAVTAEVQAAYSKTEKGLRGEFDSAIKVMQDAHAQFAGERKISADELIAELKRKETEAKRIVQVVGNVGVTGNYKNIAVSEGEAANRMRWATIGFFSSGVLITFVSLAVHLFPGLFPIATTSTGPWELFVRLVTALAVAAPAFYTARESARHRTNSDRARQRELELASLGPFIELLPENVRQEITAKMTDRYFGTEVEPHEAKSVVAPKDVSNLLAKLTELVAASKR